MSENHLIKIHQHYAADVCPGIELDEPASVLLEANLTTADFIEQLIEQQLYTDAVRFLAHALPKREATWWACLCARKNLSNKTSANDLKAIELAEAWVYKPVEANRKPTLQAAQATEFKTAASWAAIAAFWSGDDISPVPQVIVPPDEKLFAKAVFGAVMLAVTLGDTSKMTETFELFLQQGINIASGGDGRTLS